MTPHSSRSTKGPDTTRRRGRFLVDLAVVGLAAVTFAIMAMGICVLCLTGNSPGGRDVVSYWTAAHQLLQHGNPYDGAAIVQAERAVGFPGYADPLIMRNGPWSLLLVLPLGLVGLRAGALLWSLLVIASFVLAVHLLWAMHGRKKGGLQLLGYSFGPALACILAGQTAVFPLLGLVLFLRWQARRPFWAGISLWLCALKPHLFLPFAAVLLVWSVVRGRYRVLAGAGVALLASSTVATALDPGVWGQYARMLRNVGLEREFLPCLGVALRFLVRPQAMWIEYLPAVAGVAWATRYYWERRSRWDWNEGGAVVLLVSVLVAPYAWCTDQAVLIPALLAGAYRASWGQIEVLILGSALVELEELLSVNAHSAWYLWAAPFWLGWYLWVTRAGDEPGLERVEG